MSRSRRGLLREGVLSTCLERYDGVFASGVAANNKLNLDHLREGGNTAILGLAIRELVEDIRPLKPEFVVGVPSGATPLAKAAAQILEIECVTLTKGDEGIEYATPSDQRLARALVDGVVVEDVVTTLSSVRMVLELPEMGSRIMAVRGIWDRGDPTAREPLPRDIDYGSLVEEYIPPELPSDSDYWGYVS